MRKWLLLLFIFISAISRAQIISTIVGGGTGGLGDGGLATAATIGYTGGLVVDHLGNVYIADGNNQRVRKVDAITGIITTIAGTGIAGYNGDSIVATTAELNYPSSVSVDSSNNIYIGDGNNYRIRRVDAVTGIITTFAGTGVSGYTGDGGPATSAEITGGFTSWDTFGNLYIGDNNRIRKVNPTGLITTIIGSGIGGCPGDSDIALSTTINGTIICTDAYGNVYFSSIDSCVSVHKFTVSTGIVTRVAGTNDKIGYPYSGDGALATSTHIYPLGIAVNNVGIIYIADYENQRIEMIDASGIIHTVAGTGISGFSGDGGDAVLAQVSYPENVALDDCGNLYIADFNNLRIRKVTIPYIADTAVVSISSTATTVCIGTSVTYTASVTGGTGSLSYQWIVDGAVVSTTSSSYTYTPANNDSVRLIVTATNSCSGAVPAYSNTIHMTVTAPLTPSIHIVASADSICSGTAVTLTATPTYGGSSPTYEWVVDGSSVATGSTYTYTPANGDSVRALLSSEMACVTTTTASSNTVNFAIQNVLVPSITISGPTDVVEGGDVTFTATVTNAGINPVIRWFDHGSPFYTGPDNTITFIKPYGLDKITAEVIQTSFICNDSAFTADSAYVQAPTAVNNVTAHSGINIYPNPVSNILTIQSPNPINSISISNIVGQVVYTQNTPTPKAEINIAYLSAGIYFVKVNEVYVQKILKQ